VEDNILGKIESKLTNVPETMLISIRARYLETKKKNRAAESNEYNRF